MIVDVEFQVQLPEAINVPASAVINSGRIMRVFVSVGDGYFEPKSVRTGWRFKDRIQIVKGLSATDTSSCPETFCLTRKPV